MKSPARILMFTVMQTAAVALSALLAAAPGCGAAPPLPLPRASAPDSSGRPLYQSPALQRLAGAGAEILVDMGSKWNGVGTRVKFRNKEIGAVTLASVPKVSADVFLDFVDCRFEPGAFTALDGAKNVESLAFLETTSGSCVADLKSLPHLERFVLHSDEIEANDLRFLATARGLHHLALGGTAINDDVLRLVSGCDRLIEVDLWSAAISDAGLVHLESLQRLLTLGVEDCNVTDAGLKHLAALHALHALGLRGTNVTDAGVRQLVSLTHLQFLSLTRTKVTGSGLAPLTTLRDLVELNLDGAAICDEGMAGVAEIKPLTTIHLRDTNVGNSGLAKLADLPNLQLVDAIGTRATPAIRTKLPNVTVWLKEGD
jgi:hypothetical protein